MSAAPRFTPRVHLLVCPTLREAIDRRSRWLARGRDVAAEDLASIGRLALIENPVEVAPDGRAPFAYALTTAVKAMKDALRRERRMRAKQTEAGALALLSSHVFDAAANHHLRITTQVDALESAVEHLPRVERELVRAVDLSGETLQCAAAPLGLSTATACRLRKRAHATLLRALAGGQGGRTCGHARSR